jgi:hypothetical protein
MKIICHAGPWSAEYFKYVCKGISPKSTCLIASAHKSVDESNISSRYYFFLKKNKNNKYTLSEYENDIILRCRLLRALKIDIALLHLNSMRDAIVEMYETEKPDVVFSETIDSFVMDLMFFECKKRNIPFIGLVSVFINGYVRISARGEFNYVREPLYSEVSNVLNMLESQHYLPSFVNSSNKGLNYSILKRWLRNAIKIPYFALKRLYSGEKYNYHYWQALYVSNDWLHLWPRFKIEDVNWKQKLKEISDKRPVIYIPLQMIPEATVDYWCQSLDVIDYNSALILLVKKFNKDFRFLIKEHPNVIGYRNPELYEKLRKFENVIFCPTEFNSNNLVEYYDAVMVWTGTVGFECALRSKPVLALAEPYYKFGNNFKLITFETDAQDILKFINTFDKNVTPEEKHSMVKHVLSGVVPGKLHVDGTWSSKKEIDVMNALKLGNAIAEYCGEMLPKENAK